MKHANKLFAFTSLLAGAALALAPGAGALAQVTLTHVHGLAYSADGKSLYVPSHHGLAIYSEGKWSKAPGPQHDYMGFAASKNYFFSSGHPAPGSGLVNPFGIIRSNDGGKTWEKLGLERESDFHLMAASHGTDAIYVYNPAPNSKMQAPGIYSTVNQGFTWARARASGLNGEPTGLAVHPQDPKSVAVAAGKSGLYISSDSGESFRAVASDQVLAAFFDLDGKHLWYSSYAGAPALTRLNWQTGQKRTATLPPITRDAIAYIAQNPKNTKEYAIATFERSVYLSRDEGKTWTQIADRGRAP